MPPCKQTKKPKRAPAAANHRRPLTRAELEGLEDIMRAKFKWNHGARVYQMQAIEAQLQMRDTIVHAGTGMGKTAIAAGPHAHPSSEGKVTLMISPLIALHDEQVQTFRDEFKLKAIAVNSSNGGCNAQVLQDIVRGEHQIVLISPEMVLSRRFIREVLRSAEFGRRILSVVVDEAHVVSHWGALFRKKYGMLGTIRTFLPRGTPIVALSATLPARIRNDVLSKLQFSKDYINIDVGNDRPNVSIVVRGIHYPLNTYADLDFIVRGIKTLADIKKTFIYADNIATGVEIIDHLLSLLPPELRDAVNTPIRPYNAVLSKEYRKKVMRMFKDGRVKILVCTDAAGMGCNIPDIDIVVQWKLPGSVSVFVQRAGRAARADGRCGLAILLVEPSAYAVDLEKPVATPVPAARAKKKKQAEGKESAAEKKRKAAERKAYANSRGAKRGAIGGKHDFIFKQDTPILDPEAPNEGLYVLVQTGTCRRAVLTLIYGNKPAQPTVPCCDICCPELLDQTRPGKPLAVPRQSSVKRGEVNRDLQLVLHNWRISIKKRDFPGAFYSAAAIMRDETIALLASVGPLGSQAHLAKVLAGQWTWWDKYGAELYTCLAAQVIPPLKELLKKPRVKRGAGEPEESSATKRRRGNEPSISDALTTQALAGPSSTPVARSAARRYPAASAQTPEQMRASFAEMDANSEHSRRLAALFSFSTPSNTR
ncbi:P-loop containing nucleoside triphosphate hydrolase protein [Mycena pura]|uniref:DNA 3'-5' helicase n=1 Tax=Mycena pura TaxID=153505 RepID=A0AAD6Y5H2_9AGAR|nr:P-loop containing nucleoside triphosphate hydrolase protein [Mycena pura]